MDAHTQPRRAQTPENVVLHSFENWAPKFPKKNWEFITIHMN